MGVVPKADHLRLVKKYEALKEKADQQEETIRHLRMLVNQKGPDQSQQAAAAEGFQEILQRQTEQFRELMGSLSRFYGDASPSPEPEDDSS
jgi:small-conductance mechanosensitive channel